MTSLAANISTAIWLKSQKHCELVRFTLSKAVGVKKKKTDAKGDKKKTGAKSPTKRKIANRPKTDNLSLVSKDGMAPLNAAIRFAGHSSDHPDALAFRRQHAAGHQPAG